MSGVESLFYGHWSWLMNCDAMTDVVLDSQREGLLVEMVNTAHLVGPGRRPQSQSVVMSYVDCGDDG